MPLYTPRGLKLRLSKSYAFALMARLHGKETAFRVLQLTEEVENLDGLATTIAAGVALYYRVSPTEMAVICFATSLAMKLVHLWGLFIPPITFLLPISRVYSFVSGYGLLLVALCVAAYVVGGWLLLLGLIGGRMAASLVGMILDILFTKRTQKLAGFAFTASERSFFHAYRLLANRHGISTDLSVSDAEFATKAWWPTYIQLAITWPEVVSRFTDEVNPEMDLQR